VTKNGTSYYIDHKNHTTSWEDPRAILFITGVGGTKERAKIKQLRKANSDLHSQIKSISAQQKTLEQEVLMTASPETLALAKMKAMAQAQKLLEKQYRDAQLGGPAYAHSNFTAATAELSRRQAAGEVAAAIAKAAATSGCATLVDPTTLYLQSLSQPKEVGGGAMVVAPPPSRMSAETALAELDHAAAVAAGILKQNDPGTESDPEGAIPTAQATAHLSRTAVVPAHPLSFQRVAPHPHILSQPHPFHQPNHNHQIFGGSRASHQRQQHSVLQQPYHASSIHTPQPYVGHAPPAASQEQLSPLPQQVGSTLMTHAPAQIPHPTSARPQQQPHPQQQQPPQHQQHPHHLQIQPESEPSEQSLDGMSPWWGAPVDPGGEITSQPIEELFDISTSLPQSTGIPRPPDEDMMISTEAFDEYIGSWRA
jgi:hypothetical protein